MTSGNVTGIHGQARFDGWTPNEHCVKELEEALERARSGEVIGVGIVECFFDHTTTYRVSGCVGGYSMLGAVDCLSAVLRDVAMGAD